MWNIHFGSNWASIDDSTSEDILKMCIVYVWTINEVFLD